MTPGALGDLRDGRGVVPLLGEQVDGGDDEPLARAGFPSSHGPILVMGPCPITLYGDGTKVPSLPRSPMHVFVTGGTGLIGSAVVAELLGNGHTVLALARSEASARAVEAAGAEVLRGELADLDVLRAGAAAADGVIHLAFGNDFSSPEALARAVAEESAALAALGEALVGSDRPLVTVSGTPLRPGPRLHRGRPAADRRPGRRPRPLGHGGPGPGLPRSPQLGRPHAAHGPQRGQGRIRRPADRHRPPHRRVRLPGRRRPALAGRARARRGRPVPAGPGEGAGRHRLARRAPTRATPCATSPRSSAGGSACRSRRCRTETFGPLGPIFATDQPSSSARTRQALGWEPAHPSLLEDLENIQP